MPSFSSTMQYLILIILCNICRDCLEDIMIKYDQENTLLHISIASGIDWLYREKKILLTMKNSS